MKGKLLNKNDIVDLLFIIFGGVLCSISVNMFLVKANLLSSGVTGLALLFQYLFRIPSGLVILILNIPIFLISSKKLNKRFTLYSLAGMLTISLSLMLTRPFSNILNINDNLLYCFYGGVINGIGAGLVFAHNGSLGGFDIIAMLIKRKYSNFNIGNITFGINLVIISFGAVVFGLPSALYTLIAMYITSFFLDKVVKGLNQSKSVFIITEMEEHISDVILKKLHRGVTYIYGEGAYSKEKKKILYCIVPLAQLPELKRIVTEADNTAFISISDTAEIQGKGFNRGL